MGAGLRREEPSREAAAATQHRRKRLRKFAPSCAGGGASEPEPNPLADGRSAEAAFLATLKRRLAGWGAAAARRDGRQDGLWAALIKARAPSVLFAPTVSFDQSPELSERLPLSMRP